MVAPEADADGHVVAIAVVRVGVAAVARLAALDRADVARQRGRSGAHPGQIAAERDKAAEPAHVDGDGADGRAAAAVRDDVREGVGAVEAGRRRVDDTARADRGGSMRGRPDARERQRVAVAVGVVGEHRDRDRHTFERRGRIRCGNRRAVHRDRERRRR